MRKKSPFKIWLGSRLKSFRHNLSASNNPLFIGYYKYIYRPEPGGISAFFDAYSKSIPGGLQVVQIGANDGITHDPIHKFIKRDKWKGVLLEPQPFVHDTYLRPIYARNTGIHTLCAAVGPADSSQKLYKIGFSTMRWATGLASFDEENVQKAFENGLVDQQCQKYGITIPEAMEERIQSEDVQVISPETLLKTYGIEQIDLLQIDCEGYDFEVIKLFNIDKTQPKVIVFENSHIGDEGNNECDVLLLSNGYRYKNMGPNTLAMKAPLGEFASWFEA